MKYLLDTNVLIWLNEQPDKVSIAVHRVADDHANTLYISMVTAWELQIKVQLGKLNLKYSVQNMMTIQREIVGFQVLPISLDHILTLSRLSLGNYRDPFDRLIVAQAIYEQMPLISYDSQLDQYPVQIIQ